MIEVAADLRGAQQSLNSLRLGEAFIGGKSDVRGKLQIHAAGNLAAQKALVPPERREHRIDVFSAERHDVNGRQPQVGSHSYFWDGDRVAFHYRVMHAAPCQQIGECMTDELTYSQLALRELRSALRMARHLRVVDAVRAKSAREALDESRVKQRLQGALYYLDAIAFDHVGDLHVLVVLECHAAFLPGNDLTRVILEALELGELAFVHDNVVADEPHIGATLDSTVGDAATCDIADLGNLENLQDRCAAEGPLALCGREQAGHGFFYVVHEIIDDVVVANLDPGLFGHLARLLMGAHVECDDCRAGSAGQGDIRLGNAADAAMQDAGGDLVRA